MGNMVLAGILITGFVVGIRLMQSPRTARWGNRLGVLSMALAILFTLRQLGALAHGPAWLLILAGGAAGLVLGQRVGMIQMPQTVALLNGLGGGSSALVAGSAVWLAGTALSFRLSWVTASLALAIGAMTLTGSLVAALKLQGWVSSQPVHTASRAALMRILALSGVLLAGIGLFFPVPSILFFVALSYACTGVLMAVRIGGADMPVVISFLNSLSGVAAAVSGLAVGNLLLVAVGALVGVAGLILTRIMCRAMNRRFLSVLAGFQPKESPRTDHNKQTGPARPEQPEPTPKSRPADKNGGQNTDYTRWLEQAQNIVIVPGYGMALAQAQGPVRELAGRLESQGKQVVYAIHPVAGRMPGHMNVLLAEAGVDYRKLLDLEAANLLFPETDLVIVVGACDVINPAATTAQDTPISGMPILEVARAGHVIVCNLDDQPGYSGVENTLYQMNHVLSLWGDAKETLSRLIEAT